MNTFSNSLKRLVGARGFEPRTSRAQGNCKKTYLIGSSSSVLRHGTRFWTQFVSIWTQMDPSFFSQLGRSQARAVGFALLLSASPC